MDFPKQLFQTYGQPLIDRYRIWWETLRVRIREDRKGWGISLAVLVVNIIRSSITYSFGVFVVQLKKIYKRPMAELDWIGTLSFCISLSCAPISVAVVRAFKYRGYRVVGIVGTLVLSLSCMCSSLIQELEWMFLTHSLLYGVGSSFIYMASSLIIGEYFDKDHKYHVLATSILLCGYPLGSLLFNPINAWLVTSYGWRIAFRIAAGLIIVTGLPCCWVFSSKETISPEILRDEEETPRTPEPPEPVVEEIEAEQERKIRRRRCCTLAELKERPEIALWYMGNLLNYLGFYMPFVNLAYYMQLKGIEETRSSWALTLLSLSECVSYILASFFGDYLKGKLVYANVISAAALSLICILWPMLDFSYSMILFTSLTMGGFLGLTIVYSYAASGEVTKLPIDVAWSFTNLWSGVGILLGPFFSGAIYDLRHNYDDVFYVVGALFVLDALLFGGIVVMQKWREAHAPPEAIPLEKRKFSSVSETELGATATTAEYGSIEKPAGPLDAPKRPPSTYKLKEEDSSREEDYFRVN